MLQVATAALTSGSATVTETVVGTEEWAECSNRGICDRTTGMCSCSKGFSSSDGDGGGGAKGDCGLLYAEQDIEGYPAIVTATAAS